jgi:hypothetical protein
MIGSGQEIRTACRANLEWLRRCENLSEIRGIHKVHHIACKDCFSRQAQAVGRLDIHTICDSQGNVCDGESAVGEVNETGNLNNVRIKSPSRSEEVAYGEGARKKGCILVRYGDTRRVNDMSEYFGKGRD